MDDRNDDVLKQYNLKVYNTYRVRGAYVLDTDRGLKLFKSFEGSNNRVVFENQVKEHLVNSGYVNVDLHIQNTEGKLISEDRAGNKYVVKNWFKGEESNLRDARDIEAATINLAKIHKLMKNVPLNDEQAKFNTFYSLSELFDKHNRELKRVKSYIKDKKQKNEFEISYLSSCDKFYEQGVKAVDILIESGYSGILEASVKNGIVCHGNYTYHNVLLLKDGIATTNFEKCCLGVQVTDLYLFIRKVMEKNNWNLDIGEKILKLYGMEKDISKQEIKTLYVLLLYPEKFWKITNFYFNSKKSWIPQRNIQKLANIQEQQDEKENFLLFLEKSFFE